MEKNIVKDVLFLGQKSEPATREDLQVAKDLLDTLRANADHCVGLAANMIGVRKRVIVFSLGGIGVAMFNPVILRSSGEYETEEGCLSLVGLRSTKRYEEITVQYEDLNFMKKTQTYKGFVAQIIQHEIDHCNGIII